MMAIRTNSETKLDDCWVEPEKIQTHLSKFFPQDWTLESVLGSTERKTFYCPEGDLVVDGDLLIGRDDFLLVPGNLSVSGVLADMHWNEDDSSHIYVAGNVECSSLVTGSFMKVLGKVTARNHIFSLAYDMCGFEASQLRCQCLFVEGEGDLGCTDIQARHFFTEKHKVEEYSAWAAKSPHEQLFVKTPKHGHLSGHAGGSTWLVEELSLGNSVFLPKWDDAEQS